MKSLPWYGHGEDAVKVRRALSMAIDRDAINNAFYDGEGESRNRAVACSIRVWVPGSPNGRRDTTSFTPTNPEEAKRLLAEAGYPEGITGYKWSLYFIDIAPGGP